MEQTTLFLLVGSVLANIVAWARIAAIRRRARQIARRPETSTLIAESLQLLGELSGERIFARDPIGFQRKVIIERDGASEVFVELPSRSNR